MKHFLPCLLLSLLAGCATTNVAPPAETPEPEARAPQGAEDREPVDEAAMDDQRTSQDQGDESADRGDVAGIRDGLAAALDRGEGMDDFRIEVGCLDAGEFRMLEVYANGVVLWDQESQITFDEAPLREALELFRRHEFATMELFYGGKGDPAPREGAGASAKKVLCRVQLDLAGGVSKAAVQLFGGRQHPPLFEMAHELLDLAREPAASGVRAASLSDGLRKVASGELAPEALLLVLHRKTDEPDPITAETGWLVTVHGRQARGRSYGAAGGLGDELVLELAPEELARLLGSLAAETPEELPTNLWSEEYMDVTMRVLSYHHNVQAREFARMTPFTHGEKQEQFDRIAVELKLLAQQVLTYGTPTD